MKLTKEVTGAEVNVTDTPPDTSGASLATNGSIVTGDSDNKVGGVVCELARRQRLLGNCVGAESKGEAGFFEENWRSTLCTCSACKVSSMTAIAYF